DTARRNASMPLLAGYRPKSARCAASAGPTKSGIECCGSPTDKLMGGLPGSMPAMSSVNRTKGERESTAGAVDEVGSRWAVIMDMQIQSGIAPPHRGFDTIKRARLRPD